RGQWHRAREQSLQAERITRGGIEEEQIVGMAEAAKCLAMLERDLSLSEALLLEAHAIAQRKRFTVPAIAAASGTLHSHQSELDTAVECFQEARTLYKAAGDRISEFLANEYLVMIDIERGAYAPAATRCAELIDIGEKLRDGSEAPFARALNGLCRYALGETVEPLATALQELRIADAKHRLAYVLTRAAFLDIARGDPDSARQRASEALQYAQLLERATEILLARLALAQISRHSDPEQFHAQIAAIAAMQAQPVADWARQRAQPVLDAANLPRGNVS